MNFHSAKDDLISKELNTDFRNGLSQKDAAYRLHKQGFNNIKTKTSRSWVKIFFLSLSEPLNLILILAALASILTSYFFDEIDFLDFSIILTTVLINTIIVTFHEIKAQKSLKSLNDLTVPYCHVIRGGQNVELKTDELVLGDIVILQAGDVIPADLRIISCNNLLVNEANLTGESIPITKKSSTISEKLVLISEKTNMCFASTFVVNGTAKCVVVSTGWNTEIGKIAESLTSKEKTETPLQFQIKKISYGLAISSIFICSFVFLLLFFTNIEKDYNRLILLSATLAISIIPESLPIIISILLSNASYAMSKKNVLVKDLHSIETLGAINILCTDKTGTLTKNEMELVNYFICDKVYNSNQLLEERNLWSFHFFNCLALCNDAKQTDDSFIGDPTEIALIDWLNKEGQDELEIQKNNPRLGELPFDSDRKLMTTFNIVKDKKISYVKGAMEVILPRCNYYLHENKLVPITPKIIEKLELSANKLSSKGLRLLGCAYNTSNEIQESNLIFIAGVALMDPPNDSAASTIKSIKDAGISVAMITGDHPKTAFSIAKQIGLIEEENNNVITGNNIDKFSDFKMSEKIKYSKIFARVNPEHKLKIVKSFQSNKNVVAMTGDGVNDAPSLKHSDIGVAMGIQGTEVSKEAANIILSDDNLSSIIHGISEGRNVYEKIKKIIAFVFACNLGQLLSILLIVMSFHVPIFEAVHVLWFNLVIESILAIPISMEPNDLFILKQKPRNYKESILKNTLTGLFALMISIIAGVMISFAIGYNMFSEHNSQVGRTFAFFVMANGATLSSIIFQHDLVHQNKSWIPHYKINKRLLWFVALIIILNTIILFTPLINDDIFELSKIKSIKEITVLFLLVLTPAFILFIIQYIFRLCSIVTTKFSRGQQIVMKTK